MYFWRLVLVANIWKVWILVVVLSSSANAWAKQQLEVTADYSPVANYPYTNSPHDQGELTDGIKTVGHFWTSKRTVGWMNSGPIKIHLSLARSSIVSEICIESARGELAGVSLPERIDVFRGDGRGRYLYVEELMDRTTFERDGPYATHSICASALNFNAKEVLLLVTPRGRFFFTDEISVSGEATSSTSADEFSSAVKESKLDGAMRDRITETNMARAHSYYASRYSERVLDTRNTINLASGKQEEHSHVRSHVTYPELLNAAGKRVREKFGARLVGYRADNKWSQFSPLDVPVDAQGACGLGSVVIPSGHTGSLAINVTNAMPSGTFRLEQGLEGQSGSSRTPQLRVLLVEMVASKAQRSPVADALVPIEGPFVFEFGETKQFWITINASKAIVGVYSATVIFRRAEMKDQDVLECHVSVQVTQALGPTSPALHVNVWGYLNASLVHCCKKEALNDMRAHGVNVFVAHPSEVPWPGKEGVPPSKERKRLRALLQLIDLNENAQDQLLLYMGMNDPVRRTLGGHAIGSYEWRMAAAAQVTLLMEILKEQGVSQSQVAFYPIDEPKTSEDVSVLKFMSTQIKQIDPVARVFSTLGEISAVDAMAALNNVDIIQVLERDIGDLRVRLLRRAGKEIWSYNAEGGGKGASPIAFYLKQAWRAQREDLTGIGVWSYSDAGQTGNAWDDFDDRRPDFALVYVRRGKITSSKRWEAWREGVQDFALLRAAGLKVRESEKDLRTFRELVHGIADSETVDEKTLADARAKLIQLIE